MSYITTYTGKHFDPTAPEASLFDIRDIAHALSMTCRGNGHVQYFFSVGQHCINCAKEAILRGYSSKVALACLLHDAGEAYMSDVPRPFKHALPEYVEAEEKLLDMIYEKFLGGVLNEEEAKQLKQIDDDLLYFDLKILLKEAPNQPEPELKTKVDYTFRPFAEVEEEYIQIYDSLVK